MSQSHLTLPNCRMFVLLAGTALLAALHPVRSVSGQQNFTRPNRAQPASLGSDRVPRTDLMQRISASPGTITSPHAIEPSNQGDDQDTAPLDLSLNAATRLAISQSPELRQINWQIEQAHSDGYQQSRLTNPSVGAMANEMGNEGQAGQYGVYYQRNIVRNNRVEQIQNAFQWKAQALAYQSEVAQRKIAEEVGSLFITIPYLQQQIDLNARKKNELVKIQKIAESLMKGGEVAPLELTELELEIEEVNQETASWRFELDKQQAVLGSFLRSSAVVKLDFDFEAEVQLVLQSNPQRAFLPDSHPAVKEISDQIEEFKWRYQVAAGKRLPDWQLQTSLNFDFASDDVFAGFQLNIPWMVLDQKEGLINSAAIQVQWLRDEQQRVALDLERQFLRLHQQRLSLISKIKSIDTRTLPLVDQAARDTAKLFHAGEIDYKAVKKAMMQSYDWRAKRLELAKQLLQVEIQTESLLAE